MKNKKPAFTLVELLTVMGVIAILIALLLPALTMVRKMAKEAQQKVQFTTIELAILAFKDLYGDYPPSHGLKPNGNPEYYYCGAETLAEALVGWDLMGFHPKSAWRLDGYDTTGGDTTYDPAKGRDNNTDGTPDTLTERKGPYLDLATANVFRLGASVAGAKDGLFDDVDPGTFDGDRVVICDVFSARSVTVGKKTVKAGTPILYYKANTSSKTIEDLTEPRNNIYNHMDNSNFIMYVKEVADQAKYPDRPTPVNPLYTTAFFYKYIQDQKVKAVKYPSNPDSYLLISAGPDGLYGTGDDMGNFDPNS